MPVIVGKHLHMICLLYTSSGMEGGDIMYMLVRISFMICILFVFIILFYINSFIIKRRKREFGLFCILGIDVYKRQRYCSGCQNMLSNP